MSLNLHAAVRQVIPAVNPDRAISYLQSTGYAPNGAGKQAPQYADAVMVQANIQPPSGRDLRHMEFLNIQGTTRTVFLFSNPQAISRVDARGGDLLQFPQFTGAPVDNWLVAHVAETWDVSEGGWSKVYVVLQTDRPPIVIDSIGDIASDSENAPVLSS